jgi:hypothetical protein
MQKGEMNENGGGCYAPAKALCVVRRKRAVVNLCALIEALVEGMISAPNAECGGRCVCASKVGSRDGKLDHRCLIGRQHSGGRISCLVGPSVHSAVFLVHSHIAVAKEARSAVSNTKRSVNTRGSPSIRSPPRSTTHILSTFVMVCFQARRFRAAHQLNRT